MGGARRKRVPEDERLALGVYRSGWDVMLSLSHPIAPGSGDGFGEIRGANGALMPREKQGSDNFSGRRGTS